MNIIEVMQLPVGSKVKNEKSNDVYTVKCLGMLFPINALFDSCDNRVDLGSGSVLADYTLIKEKEDEKVDFMEAMKSYWEGKEVYCKVEISEDIYTYKLDRKYREDDFYFCVKSTDGDCISIGEILEGQWYIKNE